MAAAESLDSQVSFLTFESLDTFESWLKGISGWVGIDAPFGFPWEFRDALGLKGTWREQSVQLAALELTTIEQIAQEFRDARPTGQKEPGRMCDRITKSASSMKMYNPPVGKMAAAIIPVLGRLEANIWPVSSQTGAALNVIEVYCTPYARSVLGHRRPYKNQKGKETERLSLLRSLPFSVSSSDSERILADDHGDFLDALIACYEACFAPERILQFQSFEHFDSLEGWILCS